MEKSLKEHNIFENRFSTFYESRLQIGKTAVRNAGLFTSPTKPISKLTLFLACSARGAGISFKHV